jgi:amino acid adenylation domain-containing protein
MFEGNTFQTSFAQRRLWFIQTMSPQSTAYNLLFTIRLDSPSDLAALQVSLNALVARHETLRTSFIFKDGEPWQVIADEGELPLDIHDLKSWPGDKEQEFTRRVAASMVQPFVLTQHPLVRAHLGIMDEAHSQFTFVIHHIIADAHSIRILTKELDALYRATVSGRLGILPELPIQYADYAEWQRKLLSGERLKKLTEYWVQRLRGLPELKLFHDGPRPPGGTFRGAVRQFTIPAPVVKRLGGLSRSLGTTLFATLLAGFSALLGRFSGQDSLAIGTPVTGRPKPELEGVIGLFVNSLVFRVDLSENPTFRQLVHRTSLALAEDLTHQELPFELLVEALNLKRRADRNPVFQVMFQLQAAERSHASAPSRAADQPEDGVITSQFDLSFIQRETAAGDIEGAAVFAEELFAGDAIDQMIDAYLLMLDAASLEPATRVNELPLVDHERRSKILSLGEGAQQEWPIRCCLHELFERQAELVPNQVALICDDRELTFSDLNTRSTALAARLQRMGLGPGRVAAICLPRSEQLITAILAVLKAGGAFVCLDTNAPTERLRFIVNSCDAAVVLSNNSNIHGDRPLLPTHEFPQAIETPGGRAAETDPAYVIYTSGSTGQPKGIVISHRAIVNHMLWMLTQFPIGVDDRVLQRTPLTFDASIWEVFAPLLSGATLVLQPEERIFDPARLIACIKKHEITTLQVVPSLLWALIQQDGMSQCTSLRRVFCGGEVLSPELRDAFFQQSEGELCNLYGPSETTIDATFHVCDRSDKRSFVPIGKPISNVAIRVLDSHRELVPLRVPGELYIGGEALGIEYLKQPELTAERFIEDPSGARLYRTGDRVRLLPTGELQFLGRIDDQVKLRGFRIEPGEIENVLRLHDAVRESAVVIQQHGTDDQRLAAFVVPLKNHNEALSLELLDWLSDRLPYYLVPSSLEITSSLPRTAHGKIDRQSLSERRVVTAAARPVRAQPRNSIERDICNSFEELLGIADVGIDDDFFRLGGHSLLAISLQQKLSKTLGYEVNVVDLFEFATPRRLARELMNGGNHKQQPLTFTAKR